MCTKIIHAAPLCPHTLNHTVNHQTVHHTNHITQEEKVLAVFFDLSKAFDKVWKEGLLLKLLSADVHGKMYKWLSEFLFNRTARVKVDGMISRQVKLREGVPQGGVVLPTLFLVNINDITTMVPRHVSNTLHTHDCTMVR